MERKEIALKTDMGLDIYTQCADGRMTYRHLPLWLEAVYTGKVVSESDLLGYIGPGEVFETSSNVYVNSGHGLTVWRKEQICDDALEVLVNEVDNIQSTMGFVQLRVNQKKRLMEFLKELLFNISELAELIRIPIFATFNYNDHSCIPAEERQKYVEIYFGSQAWSDFLRKISIGGNLSKSAYVYSALVKQIIGNQMS